MKLQAVRGRYLQVLIGAIPLLIATVGTVVLVTRLPDQIVTHWHLADGRYTSDAGSAGSTGFVVVMLAVLAIILVGTIAAVLSDRLGDHITRSAVTVLAGLAGALAAVYFSVLLANAGSSGPAEATMPTWSLLVVLASGFLLAAAAYAGSPTPRQYAAQSVPDSGSTHLGPEERAVMIVRLRTGWLVPVVDLAVALALGLVLAASGSPIIGICLGLALFSACFLLPDPRIRADRSGVTVSIAPLTLKPVRIDLREIESATEALIEPRQWGGWGYRFSSRGRAVVLRKGPGIVLNLSNNRTFVVTTDDAAALAEFVNSLLIQARTA